ncbi:hypothetical protein R1flu_023012 [Riccia fluitans]|uniref:Uncharacterized protein n=1 Tax=Riccia fluitans TaxID=41844 RepID=A0ABD1XRB7_9MARC
MTSAVEQSGSEHPVGFYSNGDNHLSQVHSSTFWSRTNPHPHRVALISPSAGGSMGMSTPPPLHARVAVKLEMQSGFLKGMAHDLPHWMATKRGRSQPTARSEAPVEAGPSTPLKCPPRQLVVSPSYSLPYSPSTSSYVTLFELRGKPSWTIPEQTSVLPGDAECSVIASPSRRDNDQVRLRGDPSQAQKPSQRENVMSLKELKSTLQTLAKPDTSLLSRSSPVSHAALTKPKSKLAHTDNSVLINLRDEPCSRSPVNSPPEERIVDRRVYNRVVGRGSNSVGVKLETQNGINGFNACDGWVRRPGLNPRADEFSHRPVMINPTRLSQHGRQGSLESAGSLDLHADLSLGLQSAAESSRRAIWHGTEHPCEPNRPEIHSPMVNARQSKSISATPSAPQTPVVSLSLFHPSAIGNRTREMPVGQFRVDDERMGGPNDESTTVVMKRKSFRKAHTVDYCPPVELNNSTECNAEFRDQTMKRVKREALEVDPATNQDSTTGGHDVEAAPFQLWLQTSTTASHPKKHDFFPDKPRSAEGTVPSATGESPLSKVRVCGTRGSTLFRDFPREGVMYDGGFSDDTAPGDTVVNRSHLPVSLQTPEHLYTIGTDMLQETQLDLGRSSSTISCVEAASTRNFPSVLKQLGDQSEETTTPETSSQQRAKLFAVPAHAPMPIVHPTFSEGEPSLPLSLSCFAEPVQNPRTVKCIQATTPKPEEEWGKSLALCATPVPATASPKPSPSPSTPVLNFQERFMQLQAYLKHCDEVAMSQDIQVLRSLSPAARSAVAENLESRAMFLSIQEGREYKRLNSINVMG